MVGYTDFPPGKDSLDAFKRGFESSGGKDYIGFLVDAVPTAANIEYHAKIVREKALRRRLIEVSTAIVAEAFESAAPATELLDEAEQLVKVIAAMRVVDDQQGR